jgi:hypothetical protein
MNSQSLDTIVNIEQIPPKSLRGTRKWFSPQYKDKIFYVWYNHGKLRGSVLKNFVTPEMDEWGRVPEKSTLDAWIFDEFEPRAQKLDLEVQERLEALIVSEKVEMLKRHADVGLKMQDMAIGYLNEHQEEITAPAAVRMLVEGIRIERESRGIPAALDKMMNMTDEELMNEVKGLITQGNLKSEDFDADS